MLVRSFGLFWHVSEVDWHPGKGRKDRFRLLGRRGKNLPSLRVADFRHQRGIYILYSDYGPYYVGLTRSQGLGKRLKDHLTDQHDGRWTRFSWFGFRAVLEQKDPNGLRALKRLPRIAPVAPGAMIHELEALLNRTLGLSSNTNQSKFKHGHEWLQIKTAEAGDYLNKVIT